MVGVYEWLRPDRCRHIAAYSHDDAGLNSVRYSNRASRGMQERMAKFCLIQVRIQWEAASHISRKRILFPMYCVQR